MAKKIDMIKACAESCVMLTVKYDGITTRAYRPAIGAAVVQAVADYCRDYGTRGEVIIRRGVWTVSAVFDGGDIYADHYLTYKGHYRRRNVDRARRSSRF